MRLANLLKAPDVTHAIEHREYRKAKIPSKNESSSNQKKTGLLHRKCLAITQMLPPSMMPKPSAWVRVAGAGVAQARGYTQVLARSEKAIPYLLAHAHRENGCRTTQA